MEPESWPRAKQILETALELEEQERLDFVSSSCGSDLGLLEEVTSLLAAAADVDPGFLASPAIEPAAHPLPEPGESVGPYRIVRLLGEGGMGAVFLAEQTDLIERRVALKLIRAAAFDHHARERFEMECRALARMNHRHIAQVFEAGRLRDGTSFLAMEYVEGEPITRFCDRNGLGLRQRLELVVAVSEGIQHAHQAGILHRDIKPSNVLVTSGGVAKIIDFGIAVGLDAAASRTTSHVLVGTLPYMSPEALEPSNVGPGLDTRADVYALGVLLYELLTGGHPFGRTSSGLAAVVEAKSSGLAPPPSELLAGLEGQEEERRAAARGTSSRELRRRLRGDLDWIVLQATDPDREKRYASPAELVADVRRHLGDLPVLAGPRSRRRQLAKAIRRHRGAVLAATLLASSLLVGLIGTTLSARRAAREATAALQAKQEAQEVADFLIDLFETANSYDHRGAGVTAGELVEWGATRVSRGLSQQPLTRARLMDTIGVVSLKLELHARAREMLSESLELRRRHGAPRQEIAESLEHLADLLYVEGRYDEAERRVREALGLRLPSRGEGGHAIVTDHERLGNIHRLQGRYGDAESELLSAQQMEEALSGPDSARLASILHGLGVLYSHPGRLDEAEALYRRALRIRSRRAGPESVELAATLDSLAIIASMKGEREKAEPLFRRALEIRRAAVGDDHVLVASSLNNLANLYAMNEEWSAAVPLFEQALAIKRSRLGRLHPETAKAIHNLAETVGSEGDLERSEALLREAMAVWRELGAEKPEVGHTAHRLANVLRDRGKTEEAERYYRRTLEIFAANPTPDTSWAEAAAADYERFRNQRTAR